MEQILSRYSDEIYGVMRAVVGFLFLSHGLQKTFGLLGGEVASTPLLVTAGLIELIGGLCIMLGLFTRYAAFLCSGLMAVAYFIAHQPQGALPILNRGELAVVYSFVFLMVSARGPGAFSLDGLRGVRRLSTV